MPMPSTHDSRLSGQRQKVRSSAGAEDCFPSGRCDEARGGGRGGCVHMYTADSGGADSEAVQSSNGEMEHWRALSAALERRRLVPSRLVSSRAPHVSRAASQRQRQR